MWKLLLFFVAAAVVSWVATWLADNPGVVVVDWLDWRIETTMGVLLVAALLLCAVAILLFEVARWLFGLPRRLRERRVLNRTLRGYRALAGGLVAAAAGDPVGARHFARQAEKLLAGNDPTLHLLEAQRAQLEGNEEEALREFRAMLKTPETELLGLRGMLAYALKAGDREDALALARRAYRRSPNTPWVLITLFDLLTREGEWQEALAVLNQIADLRLVGPDVARRRRAILWAMMAEDAQRAGRTEEALRLLRRAFRLMPGFAPVAVRLARLAREVGRPRLARKVLERAWKTEAHPDVARAYMELYTDRTPVERVKAAQRLRSLKPFEPLSYLVVAEAEMAAGALDAARHALIRAEEMGATAHVFRLRAELERLAGAGEEVVRQWLARADEAPADRAWVCEDTGEVFPEWKPFGATGRFDAVQWTVPPKVARLAAGEAPVAFVPHRAESVGTGLVPAGDARPSAAVPGEASSAASKSEERPGSTARPEDEAASRSEAEEGRASEEVPASPGRARPAA